MNDSIAYWNGPAAARWVRDQTERDRMLRPFGRAALDSAAVALGEAVLDVGCGCGDTLVSLAALVGAGGRVVGLDASAPMLARARERCAGQANVSFVEGDASSAAIGPAPFDALYSRFGVMFFVDPVRAFLRLRGALRTGGRLSFVCWRTLGENPWAEVPFDVVAGVLGRPELPPPAAPGPFSFGEPARVRGVLEAAGFRGVDVRGFDATVTFGASGSLDDASSEVARLGPTARLLEDRDEADVTRALAAIRRAIRRYANAGGGACFPGAAWIVTARNAG